MDGGVLGKNTLRSGVREALEDHFLEYFCGVFFSSQMLILFLEVDPFGIERAQCCVLILRVWKPLQFGAKFGNDSAGVVELALENIQTGFVLTGCVDKVLDQLVC